MFSLDWIKTKTELVGPAHLIHEYAEYSQILDEKVYCEKLATILRMTCTSSFT